MHFADFTAGRIIDAGSREVSESEIIEFARKYDPQWFHTDVARASASRWKGLISSGWLTCAVAMELAVKNVLADSESIGSPGVEQLKWPAPVRPGDVLSLRIEVLEARVSRSGSVGVVRWKWLLTNQHGVTVLETQATSLFEIRS